MPKYVQADRPLTVTTPIGADKLLMRGFSGHEGVSQLFRFQLDLIAESTTDVAFDKLIGQPITIHLQMADKKKRHFNGLCVRFSEGERNQVEDSLFTSYRAEIVPKFWLLTHIAQSRIFQHISVPDILKKVLVGFDVSYDIRGKFEPRDFCVQYRETDFNFASRLMEEEGIFYFFKHTDGNHTMVVSNASDAFVDVTGNSKITYENWEGTGFREDDRIFDWEKFQELRSGKYKLWDHSFELPHEHLEAEKTIQDSVGLGKVSHKLKIANNDKLELYDWPGEYAQRFDGVNKGGGDQAGEIQKIFTDNKRTVEIRMQEEALPSLVVQGASNCRQFTSGHKFKLLEHFSGEGGPYVLTTVTHSATGGGTYRGGLTGEAFGYTNQFTCIPQALPFRPPRLTPKPVVQGSQTAVVVGPSGEEIFTDKYSRVKVQFHWDREGKKNEDSSCWIRVATHWAGKQWGMIHIPRIGQEVVVDFLEGDPDQPIIVGSVYNAEMMPPYQLPGDKTQSGIKTRSSMKGGTENFNEICFEDKKGQELLYIRAEKDMTVAVESDEAHWVGHDREKTIDHDENDTIHHDWTIQVDNNRTAKIGMDDSERVGMSQTIQIGTSQSETIGTSQTLTVTANQSETVGGSKSVSVAGTQSVTVGGSASETVGGSRSATVGGADSTTVGGARSATVGGADSVTVGGALSLTTGGATTITAGGATMMTAGGAISITAGGAITVTAGGAVAITAGGAVTLTATAIMLVGIVLVGGIVITPTLISASVVSPTYTPGLGNMI